MWSWGGGRELRREQPGSRQEPATSKSKGPDLVLKVSRCVWGNGGGAGEGSFNLWLRTSGLSGSRRPLLPRALKPTCFSCMEKVGPQSSVRLSGSIQVASKMAVDKALLVPYTSTHPETSWANLWAPSLPL